MPDGIPPSQEAHQIPPPTGYVQRALVAAFGYSYRTTLAGITSGVAIAAAGISAGCPVFINTGQITKHEFFAFLLAMLGGGGTTKGLISAKDKSVTGVEK